MLGAIIGDIAGSVYEFGGIKTKDFPLFGDHGGQKCRFTDDSAMTLAVAGALLEAAEKGEDPSACGSRAGVDDVEGQKLCDGVHWCSFL